MLRLLGSERAPPANWLPEQEERSDPWVVSWVVHHPGIIPDLHRPGQSWSAVLWGQLLGQLLGGMGASGNSPLEFGSRMPHTGVLGESMDHSGSSQPVRFVLYISVGQYFPGSAPRSPQAAPVPHPDLEP